MQSPLQSVVAAGRADDIAELIQIPVAHNRNTATAVLLVPEPAARPAVSSAWYGLVIEHAVSHGYADLGSDRRSAAIWLDRTTPVPAPPDYLRRLTATCGRYSVAQQQYERILQRHRPRTGHAEPVVLTAGAQSAPPLLTYRHRRPDDAFITAHAMADDATQTEILVRAGYQPASAHHELPDGPRLIILRRIGAADAVPSGVASSGRAS